MYSSLHFYAAMNTEIYSSLNFYAAMNTEKVHYIFNAAMNTEMCVTFILSVREQYNAVSGNESMILSALLLLLAGDSFMRSFAKLCAYLVF